MKFINPIPYHLNVSQLTGQICLGLLKADVWEPTSSIKTLLHAISVSLTRPESDTFVDDDVNYNYHNNRGLYNEKAKKSIKK